MATTKTLLDIRAQLDSGKFSEQWKALSEKATKDLGQSLVDAVDLGFNPKNLKGFEAKLQTIQAAFRDNAKKMEKLEAKRNAVEAARTRKLAAAELITDQAQAEVAKKRAEDNYRRALAAIQERVESEKEIVNKKKVQFEQELKHISLVNARQLENLKELEEFQSKSRSEKADAFVSGLRDGLDDLRDSDFTGVAKRFAKAMGKAGLMTGGGLGRTATGVATGAMAIAGLLGVLGLLVKVFAGADDQAKDFNQTLLGQGQAAVELSTGLNSVYETMSDIRKRFTQATSENLMFGTTPQERLEILNAFQEAGMTIKELGEASKTGKIDVEKLGQATLDTIKLARAFGQSGSEMAANIAAISETIGGDRRSVLDSLGQVAVEADKSGYGVKRFFTQVLNATSGMAGYNVRVAEAAGLLGKLGKVFGPERGAEFVQGLTKGFAESDVTENMKRVLLAGPEAIAKTLQELGARTQEDFLNKYGGNLEVKAAFGGAFPSVTDLSKMSQEQTAELIGALQGRGQEEAARNLTTLVKIAEGQNGSVIDQARALNQLDMTAKMELGYITAQTRFGKDIHALAPLQLRALQEMLGFSSEQMEQYRDLSRTTSGGFDALVSASKDASFADSDLEKTMVKNLGATVRNGQVVAASLDENGNVLPDVKKVFKDKLDLLLTQGKITADQDKLASSLAQEAAFATTKLSDVVQHGTNRWLEWINQGVEAIVGFLFGNEGREEQQKALALANASVQSAQSDREKLIGELGQLKQDFATDQTPGGRSAIQARMREMELKLAEANEKLTRAQTIRREVLASDTSKDDTNAMTMLDRARRVAFGEGGMSPEVRGFRDEVGVALQEAVKGSLSETDISHNPVSLQRIMEFAGADLAFAVEQGIRKGISAEELASQIKGTPMWETLRLGEKLQRELPIEDMIKVIQDMRNTYDIRIREQTELMERTLRAERYFQDNPMPDMLKPLGPKANDLLVQMGGNGNVKWSHRVDPNDMGIIAKPGGALSRAAPSGGNVSINNHFYNDSKGIWNSMLKYEKAMGARRR